jgi:hypothetical protein
MGSRSGSPATTSSWPSGDQAGSKPWSVTRRTDSPVAPITKIPPPLRSQRKAIWLPLTLSSSSQVLLEDRGHGLGHGVPLEGAPAGSIS